jgi:hypothetical protein
MWAGAKSINLTQDGAMGNLCVKCHQPRPLAKSSSISDGNVVNYDSLKNFPALVFYNSAVGNAAPNKVVPSYRTHIHYGAVGAVFAGVGGIEFPGTLDYTSSPHATAAACQNCHMATLNGVSGGHTFWAKGNFNGCNVAGCHDANPVSATSSLFTNTRTATKALLDQLAAKINTIGGATPILHSEPDATANLWAGLTTGLKPCRCMEEPRINQFMDTASEGHQQCSSHIPVTYQRTDGGTYQFPALPQGIQPWNS